MEEKYSDTVRDFDIEAICSDSKFGELNFQAVVPILKQMIAEIVELENLDFRSHLTDFEINQIEGVRNTLRSYIQQIIAFTITQDNASQARDVILQTIQSFYQNTFASQIRPSLVYLRDKVRANTKNNEAEYRKLAAELQKLVAEVKQEKEKLKTDQESIKVGQGIVSSRYLSDFFKNEAADNKEISSGLYEKFNFWIRTLFATVVVLFGFYLYFRTDFDNSSKIEYGVFSATIIAIVFFYIKVVLREYNITKHIETGNKHRANVASTLEGFLSQAEQDIELKTHLVKEASSAIFKTESTGYLSKDQIEVSTPIKEVVNTIMTK